MQTGPQPPGSGAVCRCQGSHFLGLATCCQIRGFLSSPLLPHDTSFCFHGPSLGLFASTVLSAELLELEEPCENQQSLYLLLKGAGLWAVASPPLTATGLEASELGLTLLQSLLEMFIQELSDFSV